MIVLIATVAAVGVLHTMVPDHWAPIAVLARAKGWTRAQTARTAALAGTGHVVSTLVLGAIVWAVGSVAARHYANVVDRIAAAALIVFGLWMAIASWREIHRTPPTDATSAYRREPATSGRTALLLILGSSPMIEGLPAFFAASTYGARLLGTMAVVFAAATIATYVVLSTVAHGGLERVSLGRFERYGEVISGALVAAAGVFAALT